MLERSHGSSQDWHATRLRIKRVRYRCETYAVWVRSAGALLDDLKHVQSVLGNEHDLSLSCANVDKDLPLRPLLESWLAARVEVEREVQAALRGC